MNFNRLKTLFTWLIAVSSILTLAIGIATALQMAKLESTIDVELDVSEKLIEALGELKLQVVQIQQFLTDAAATGEPGGEEDARKAMQAAKAALVAIVAADSGYAGEAQALEQGTQRLYDTGLKMLTAYGAGREAGNEFMKSPDGFDKQSDALQEKVDTIAKHITAQQGEANMQVTAAIRLTRTLNLALSAILIVVIVGISIFTYRRVLSIVGAEPEIGARLTQYLAQGELGRNIDLRQGDGESLLARLSQMKARWTDVVAGLRGQSEILALASTELAERSHRMSTDSQAQSDTANGIAASVEQFTVSIDEIAAKAREANGNVKRTGEASASASAVIEHIAEEVQQVASTVQQSAAQVGELDASTRGIATVVELIREVADQTNLIALNAAIEAARAGEAGRGFAVVADEVRKLAERTTQSTADIARRIDEVHDVAERIVESIGYSVKRVEASVALSHEALESMASVRGQAAEASRQVGEIDRALDEQRAGAHQITASVEGIARMAESNAEGARVVSGHSDRIDEIAKAIDAEVGYFKLARRGNDASDVLF